VAFDAFAEDYDAALEKGLAVSGESKDYFAQKRVEWLRACLKGETPTTVLDFGCGTGSATPYLLELLEAEQVIGVDVSERSLAVARRTYPERAVFQTTTSFVAEEAVDVAYCNGVFHHIPPKERAAAVALVYRALRPGGRFSFWENSPWNVGTQYVMWRIPFDRDAIKVPMPEAVRLLKAAGFAIERVDFQFVFPRSLGFLRGMEKYLAALPLGAQYQVLCRKA
jgi:SAM-dependent methyltransferase